MVGSKAFQGIKRDVLKIVAAIPKGNVVTHAAIGEFMTVMPRHVAYILSRLEDEELERVPWHRVVGKGGKLGKERRAPSGETQRELLEAEGVLDGATVALEAYEIAIKKLRSGVKPGQRYDD